MNASVRCFAALLAVIAPLASLPSEAGAPSIVTRPFASGFSAPVDIARAGDGSNRLYVVEQAGRVRIVQPDGRKNATPFLDISGIILSGGEQGLLGLAFHPRYAQNGRFFVYYNRPAASGSEIAIARYTRSAANPEVADPASGVVLLTFAHPQFANHNGGRLAFGPDGYLYAGTGDGGGGGDPFKTGQNLMELRGKILRIDVDGPPAPGLAYAIPISNPFSARNDARGEIFAYGLRNPWRFSFDRATGDLFIEIGRAHV